MSSLTQGDNSLRLLVDARSVTAISTADDEVIPKSKRMRSESNPISDETIALIKEKYRLRRQYSQNKDPAVKMRINQLQKQVKEELRVEMQASWENSAILLA